MHASRPRTSTVVVVLVLEPEVSATRTDKNTYVHYWSTRVYVVLVLYNYSMHVLLVESN